MGNRIIRVRLRSSSRGRRGGRRHDTGDVTVGVIVQQEFLARTIVESSIDPGIAVTICHESEGSETARSAILVKAVLSHQ